MEEQQAHIQLTSADVADDAIIFGDPARIDRITRQLDDFVELKYNREFRSVKGSYKRKTILILSTV